MSPEEITQLENQVKGLTANGQALRDQLHDMTDVCTAVRTNLNLMNQHYNEAMEKNKHLVQLNQVLESQGKDLNAENMRLNQKITELTSVDAPLAPVEEGVN